MNIERIRELLAYSPSDGAFYQWAKHAKAWCAQIRHNRHTKNLGYFKNIDEAIAARKAAEVALGFHVNHGAQK